MKKYKRPSVWIKQIDVIDHNTSLCVAELKVWGINMALSKKEGWREFKMVGKVDPRLFSKRRLKK